MTADQRKECPVCGYPLAGDGYCAWCKEKPRFPPPGFRRQVKISVGTPHPPGSTIVKKYQFMDTWQGHVAEFGDLWEKSVGVASDALREGRRKDVIALYQFAAATLEQSTRIPKILVEPTEWDKHFDEAFDHLASLRVKEGVYFGLVDTAQAALQLILAIVFLNPADWKSILDLLAGGVTLSRVVDHFAILSGNPKIVFEAIYRKCSTLDVVNYPELKNPVSKDGAYGFRGPTTDELEAMLAPALPAVEIRDSLIELQKKRIIVERDGRWYIRT